jgi:hypothetical protein
MSETQASTKTEASGEARLRTLTGRVVSNKMQKTVTVLDRAPGQARPLRQVHPPHDQAACP